MQLGRKASRHRPGSSSTGSASIGFVLSGIGSGMEGPEPRQLSRAEETVSAIAGRLFILGGFQPLVPPCDRSKDSLPAAVAVVPLPVDQQIPAN